MNINIKYGVDSITKTYQSTPTVGQVLRDSNIKVVLGYGDNVRALINGVEQSESTLMPSGATLVIETRANAKAAPDVTVTVKYGVDQVKKTLPGPITVGDILDDDDMRAVLGYGDNVRCLINGVEQPHDAGLHHGCTLTIETRANAKAN